MTVAKLIEELKKLPQDALVIMFGGDEASHLASKVVLTDSNQDVELESEVKGPFVEIL